MAVEEYITIDEVCSRIGYKRQSIYNFVSRGVLLPGTHFTKPRGKLLFKWSGLQKWLEQPAVKKPKKPVQEETSRQTSKIRI